MHEVPRKLRDVLNVSHSILCPGEEPLRIGPAYWELRDKVSQCELLLLRVFRFEVGLEVPHKMAYNVLHYAVGPGLRLIWPGFPTVPAHELLSLTPY